MADVRGPGDDQTPRPSRRAEAVNTSISRRRILEAPQANSMRIDVDQSGLLRCRFTPSTRVGAVAAMPSSRDRATQAPWTPSNF